MFEGMLLLCESHAALYLSAAGSELYLIEADTEHCEQCAPNYTFNLAVQKELDELAHRAEQLKTLISMHPRMVLSDRTYWDVSFLNGYLTRIADGILC